LDTEIKAIVQCWSEQFSTGGGEVKIDRALRSQALSASLIMYDECDRSGSLAFAAQIAAWKNE